jgi:hypothetical protein
MTDITTAVSSLRAVQEDHDRQWDALFRVIDLAERMPDHRAELLAHACSIECDLLGRCDLLGAIVDELVAEGDDELAAKRGETLWRQFLAEHAGVST